MRVKHSEKKELRKNKEESKWREKGKNTKRLDNLTCDDEQKTRSKNGRKKKWRERVVYDNEVKKSLGKRGARGNEWEGGKYEVKITREGAMEDNEINESEKEREEEWLNKKINK